MERTVQKKNYKLILVFILAVLYACFDAFNSAGTGNDDGNRLVVYVFLTALVSWMMVNIASKRYIKFNQLTGSMLVFLIYIAVNYVFIKNERWSAVVVIGLAAWWMLSIMFFGNELSDSIYNLSTIYKFARIMFVFYMVIVIYGSINIAKNPHIDHARVGYIYHILALLPILLLEQNKKIRNVYIIVTLVLTIFSFKRGGILILPIMLLSFFIVENKTKRSKNNIVQMFFFAIALVIIWIVFDYSTDGFLSSRFTIEELSDGSGRFDIYGTILNNLSKRGIVQLVFGIATNNETAVSVGAHNEWLGRLDSLGIVGFVLFAIVFWYMAKPVFEFVKTRSIFAPSYAAMVAFIIGISMVSGLYFVHFTFYIMIYIAIAISLHQKEEKTFIDQLTSKGIFKI